ncbi:MAG: dTDP-4-dehydrorhamnose 3,5-epimerase [Chitinophagaceae bacterium]|nr:dTDP-4-dehydrorhamnose 3,5-epimerase [Chitinophagaceae bacterium]
MPFTPTTFPGLIVIDPVILEDSRGYFFEAYSEELFHVNNIKALFVQDNQSKSSYGVVRGLHYQKPPHAQSKLIRVLSGTIVDTVLDLRVGSPTFGETFSIHLSAENKKQLFIPKGFAHGFSVITKTAEVLYKCDAYYNRDSESGILYNDPELNIDWEVPTGSVMVSDKDRLLPTFNSYAGDFTFNQ